MAKTRRTFQSVAEALAFLRTNRDLDINEEFKVIKIKEPVGLKYLSAIDFLCLKTEHKDHGWSHC